jgi:hypothetical protein
VIRKRGEQIRYLVSSAAFSGETTSGSGGVVFLVLSSGA